MAKLEVLVSCNAPGVGLVTVAPSRMRMVSLKPWKVKFVSVDWDSVKKKMLQKRRI